MSVSTLKINDLPFMGMAFMVTAPRQPNRTIRLLTGFLVLFLLMLLLGFFQITVANETTVGPIGMPSLGSKGHALSLVNLDGAVAAAPSRKVQNSTLKVPPSAETKAQSSQNSGAHSPVDIKSNPTVGELQVEVAASRIRDHQSADPEPNGAASRADIPENRAGAKLEKFISSVVNGQPRQAVGVFVEETFSLPITQQPVGNPGFVSSQANVATQFNLAAKYGTLGLLAHNHLAGSLFFSLEIGQEILVVYGGGEVGRYLITEINQYQALQPTSPYSDFINLEDQENLSVKDLFYSTYGIENRVVLQTCIARDGVDSWGRLIVVATPVDDAAEKSLSNLPYVEPDWADLPGTFSVIDL